MNANRKTSAGRRSPSRHSPSRRGVATLEFVLALPFLMFVFTGILSVTWATLWKTHVHSEVRNKAWKKRSASAGTQPLTLPALANPTAGIVGAESEDRFRVYRWFGGDKTAKSKNAVMAGSWDYREVPEFQGSRPHFGVLRRMASGGGLQGANVSGLRGMLQLLNMGINVDFADDASDASDDARDRAEQNRDRAERQLAGFRRELAAEQRRLDELESRREELEDRLDDLQDQRDPPPAPEGLEEDIAEVEDDINSVSSQINASRNRIREIQRALRRAENGLQQAEEMLDSLS